MEGLVIAVFWAYFSDSGLNEELVMQDPSDYHMLDLKDLIQRDEFGSLNLLYVLKCLAAHLERRELDEHEVCNDISSHVTMAKD